MQRETSDSDPSKMSIYLAIKGRSRQCRGFGSWVCTLLGMVGRAVGQASSVVLFVSKQGHGYGAGQGVKWLRDTLGLLWGGGMKILALAKSQNFSH